MMDGGILEQSIGEIAASGPAEICSRDPKLGKKYLIKGRI